MTKISLNSEIFDKYNISIGEISIVFLNHIFLFNCITSFEVLLLQTKTEEISSSDEFLFSVYSKLNDRFFTDTLKLEIKLTYYLFRCRILTIVT